MTVEELTDGYIRAVHVASGLRTDVRPYCEDVVSVVTGRVFRPWERKSFSAASLRGCATSLGFDVKRRLHAQGRSLAAAEAAEAVVYAFITGEPATLVNLRRALAVGGWVRKIAVPMLELHV
ncbi:MAG: hypothetical protein WC731_06480 [Candidatus Omnitrophota bacterium]|jgi:hypothetical protein